MGKRTGIVDKQVLLDADLPEATETYTVISHESIIDTIFGALNERGFAVKSETYRCNEDARVAQGTLILKYKQEEVVETPEGEEAPEPKPAIEDNDLGMMFTFTNSYDKSTRFKCAIGGAVHLNGACIIASDMSTWGRKHTGTSDKEMMETVNQQLENAGAYFAQLVADKEAMKKVQLTRRQFAELTGVLYTEMKILSGEQIKIVRNQFNKPSFAYTGSSTSLWTLYNHIIVALAKSHPKTWMEQQKIVHLHLMTEFNLTQFDEEEVEGEAPQATQETVTPETEEVTPPIEYNNVITEENPPAEVTMEGQTDLEQSIEEVKGEEVMMEQASEPVVIERNKAGEPLVSARTVVLDMGEPSAAETVTAESVPPTPSPVLPGFGTPQPKPAELKESIVAPIVEAITPEPKEVMQELVTDKVEEMIHEEMVEKGTDTNSYLPSDTHDEANEMLHGVDNGDIEITVTNDPINIDVMKTAEVEINSEDVFISKQDILAMDPGAEVGSIVVLADEPYEILKADTVEGIEGFYLREGDVVEEESAPWVEETPTHPEPTINANGDAISTMDKMKPYSDAVNNGEAVIVGAESAEEEAEVKAALKEAGIEQAPFVTDEEEDKVMDAILKPIEVAAPVDPLEDVTEVEAPTEKLEEVVEEFEEEKTPEEVATEEDDEVRTVISQELYELYGSFQEYTYKLKDGQYNVTLNTGEVIILTRDEIDSRL